MEIAAIARGVVILLGVAPSDSDALAEQLAERCARLRIFPNPDEPHKHSDRSLLDVGGSALVVSQFTLVADTSRGRRPGFAGAAEPDHAKALYERFATHLESLGVPVQTGRFGADMAVGLVNDGPVTYVLEH